jgi:hypothetical protein
VAALRGELDQLRGVVALLRHQLAQLEPVAAGGYQVGLGCVTYCMYAQLGGLRAWSTMTAPHLAVLTMQWLARGSQQPWYGSAHSVMSAGLTACAGAGARVQVSEAEHEALRSELEAERLRAAYHEHNVSKVGALGAPCWAAPHCTCCSRLLGKLPCQAAHYHLGHHCFVARRWPSACATTPLPCAIKPLTCAACCARAAAEHAAERRS